MRNCLVLQLCILAVFVIELAVKTYTHLANAMIPHLIPAAKAPQPYVLISSEN